MTMNGAVLPILAMYIVAAEEQVSGHAPIIIIIIHNYIIVVRALLWRN